MKISLHNRYFKPISQSPNGEVSDETVFHYRQQGDIIWATYEGGSVLWGTLSGIITNHELIFTYQHINQARQFKTGSCKTTIMVTKEGLRLLESWQWTCDDYSTGSSELIEIVT